MLFFYHHSPDGNLKRILFLAETVWKKLGGKKNAKTPSSVKSSRKVEQNHQEVASVPSGI